MASYSSLGSRQLFVLVMDHNSKCFKYTIIHMNALQTLLSPVVNGACDTNEQAVLCSYLYGK